VAVSDESPQNISQKNSSVTKGSAPWIHLIISAW